MNELCFPDPPLADDIVRLRPWSASDVGATHAATQDALIPRFTRVPANQSREDVRRFIDGREPARKSGSVLPLVIADAGSGDLMGSISLMEVDLEQRVAGVGFWLAPWARGRGLATRSVRLLSHWALAELGLARVQLGAYPDNDASQRVAERCGFVRDGVRRAFLEVNGERRDVVMFSLGAADDDDDDDVIADGTSQLD